MTNLKFFNAIILTLTLSNILANNCYAKNLNSQTPSKSQQDVIDSLIEHYQDKEINIPKIDIQRSKRERGTSAINKVTLSKDNIDSNIQIEDSTKVSSDILNMSMNNFTGIKNAKELIAKGYEAYNIGHYEAAMSLYQQASHLTPNNIDAQFGVAVVHQMLGHMSDAKKIYLQILQKYPENKYALNNFINILSLESPNEALTTLQKLEQAEPNLAIIPAQIAAIYHRQKDFKQAIIYYKKAARIDPKRIEYVYNMAVLFEKINQPKDSIILYNRILQAIEAGYESTVSISDVNHRLKQISNREIQNGA